MDKSKIRNLWSNSIGLHELKHKEIMQIYDRSKDIKLKLYLYFSQISDLIFNYNSFLLNYCIEEKLFKNYSFSHKNNGNEIVNMLKKIKPKIDKEYIDRIRMYQLLFRHTYAHGNLLNVINFLSLNNPMSPPFIMYVENANKENRLRILLDNNLFSEIKTFNPNYLLKKIKNDESDWYLLDENSSRTYMVWKSHCYNTMSSPELNYLLSSFFNQNHRNDENLLKLGILITENDTCKKPNITVSYKTIKKDIDWLLNYILKM
jgi:hypothetical protein